MRLHATCLPCNPAMRSRAILLGRSTHQCIEIVGLRYTQVLVQIPSLAGAGQANVWMSIRGRSRIVEPAKVGRTKLVPSFGIDDAVGDPE
jgi:hypothetical protein